MYELVTDRENNKCVLRITEGLGVDKLKSLHSFLQGCDWEIEQVDRLSLDQQKMIWALCKDYGEFLGNTATEMRGILQNEFCGSKDIPWFSISPYKSNSATMELATEFIQFIIEHSINEGYNIIIYEGYGEKRKAKSSRELCPDIRKYVLAHLLNKSCCCCGKKTEIDLHHSPQLGVPKEQDDGFKTGFMSLCRECHTNAHSIGLKEFEKMYHLQPAWLSANLIRELKKVYTGHFQAFKEADNES